MRFTNICLSGALLPLLIINTIAADDSNEFALDLFSDVAPILALFGEQFARQFLSESFTWLDHLIFACVPLGILTALSGAIRVQGPKIAQAFIGRARENRATTELELMSSTSQEVCEMFNGKGIIRIMGRPRIAQIIIFPDIYNKCRADTGSGDSSCGIYTLRTVVDLKDQAEGVMEYKRYHSKSYRWATSLMKHPDLALVWSRCQRWPPKLVKHLKAWRQKEAVESDIENNTEPNPPNKPSTTTEPATEDDPVFNSDNAEPNPRSELPNTTVPALGDDPASNSNNGHHKSLDFLGPPNLHLNMSSGRVTRGRKGEELFAAGVFAVLLQLALLVIAFVMVYHQPTRESIGYDPEPYGLPCYIGGSVVLLIGMAICSLAIESGTVEYVWERHRNNADTSKANDKKVKSEKPSSHSINPSHARVIWLQPSQRVNDQPFDSYVILGGPKRYLITSSRQEDELVHRTSSRQEDELDHGTSNAAESDEKASSTEQPDESENENALTKWEMLTLVGVSCGAIGFISQFIGLRGLPWPCSVSQLLAILAMALLRALVRRRLGKIPLSCAALSEHELDYLATQIVLNKDFREFKDESDEGGVLKDSIEKITCQWKVVTPEPEITKKFPPPGLRSATLDATDNSTGAQNKDPCKPSSQGLVCVRERVGDLCQWTTSVSSVALALAQSMERFLKTFKMTGEDIDWTIETSTLPGSISSRKSDSVLVKIVKRENEWNVEIGKLEAILSLWKASFEAKPIQNVEEPGRQGNGPSQTQKKAETSEWRRSKAAAGSKVSFYRILGDERGDRVLGRNISWWIGGHAVEQAVEEARLAEETEEARLNPKRIRRESSGVDQMTYEVAKEEPEAAIPRRGGDKVSVVIGFNSPETVSGKYPAGCGPQTEISVISDALLPVVLAQHLFTTFMWKMASLLGKDCFRIGDHNIAVEATKVNSGGFDPYAFEETWYRQRLSTAQLEGFVKYAENMGLGSAADILLCMVPALTHYDLLPNERMLDLLPHDFQKVNIHGWAQTAKFYHSLLKSSLGVEAEEYFALAAVVKTMDFIYLASEPYNKHFKPDNELDHNLRHVVCRLAHKFPDILRKLSPAYDLQKRRKTFMRIFDQYIGAQNDATDKAEDGVRSIDFPKWDPENKEQISFLRKVALRNTRLNLHEQGFNLSGTSREEMEEIAKKSKEVKQVDIFRWTALHYTAIGSRLTRFMAVMDASIESQPIHQYIDSLGRNPAHQAALHGKDMVLEWMLGEKMPWRQSVPISPEDSDTTARARGHDGMTPMHLAVKGRHIKCVKALLKYHRSTEADIWGRRPIHLAAVAGDSKIAEMLLGSDPRSEQVDKFGRTPLLLAMLSENMAVAKVLLEKGAKPSAKDHDGATPLMLACRNRQVELVELMLEKYEADVSFQDNDGRTALHYLCLKEPSGTENDIPSKDKKSDNGHPIDRDTDARAKDVTKAKVTNAARIIDIIIRAWDRVITTEIKDQGVRVPSKEDGSASPNRDPRPVLSKIDTCDQSGQTPLHIAAELGDSMLTKALLDHHADPSIKGPKGGNALHYAVARSQRKNNLEQKELLSAIIDSAPTLTEKDQILNDPDNDGRTPLHIAICADNDIAALYLLQKGTTPKTTDKMELTPLLSACKSDEVLLDTIEYIVQRADAEMINQGDPFHDESPIAWACQRGHPSVVKALMASKHVDLNRPATKCRGYTPLHFALAQRKVAIVKLLLNDPRIKFKWNQREANDITLLEHALNHSNNECMITVLLDSRVGSHDRIKCLKTLAKQGRDVFGPVLDSIPESDLTPSILDQMIYDLPSLAAKGAIFDTWMRRAKRDWKQMVRPLYILAMYGEHEAITDLEKLRGSELLEADRCYRDEDGWTCSDVAKMHSHLELAEKLAKKLGSSQLHEYPLPSAFFDPFNNPNIRFPKTDPKDQEQLLPQAGSLSMKMDIIVELKEVESYRTWLRTKECIPPNVTDFYFEVCIVKRPSSRYFAIGYTQVPTAENEYPGYNRGSWAYHMNNGTLFINSLQEKDWPYSKKLDEDIWEEGDVVGCGLDLLDGKGYCTRNGKKLDSSDAFDNRPFNRGKIYPCIGFPIDEDGDGLHVQVSFGTSIKPADSAA